MQNFNFLKKVVLRTPLNKSETDITPTKIEDFLSNPFVKESLFIASPAFQGILENNDEFTDRMMRTAYKYYSRISNRCTPFGLFASVSTLSTDVSNSLNIADSTITKNIKYDTFFLGLITDKINKDISIKKVLKFYPNNSLYKILDKYRYVEFYYEDNNRFHRISEVEHSEYLETILKASKTGKTIEELQDCLVNDHITYKDANQFLNAIIDSQFLVSELDLSLSGEDLLDTMLQIFNQERFIFKEGVEILNLLNFLKKGLKELEAKDITPPEDYRQLFEQIKQHINVDTLEIKKLFQVDIFKNIPNGTISYDVLKKVRQGIVAVNKLTPYYPNSNVASFKRKFQERYEENMLPLCQVLDPDSGIGYNITSGAKTPLLNGLNLQKRGNNDEKVKWNAKHAFLLEKIHKAYRSNSTTIALTDDDLAEFKEDQRLYPETFSAFFNIINEDNTDKICLKSIAGPSGNNLIGRFGYLDESLLEISNEICAIEKNNHPNKLIAEIMHLPEARTGNVLNRKFQRDYEIPYLAKSTLSEEKQILINDLFVTVRDNRVILFSKKHNKEIIPKLGNAHNFSYKALPIYYFLCDLQNQESDGFGFSWGSIVSSFTFLPRLTYKDVILSKAKWNFKKRDFESILSDQNSVVAKVKQFVANNQLPDVVVLAEGDNEIVLNFKNDLSCQVFYDMIKSKKHVELHEFLMANNSTTDGYANECIAFGAKTTITNYPEPTSNTTTLKENNLIGSDWLYYKLYCGHSSAEEVLKKTITPVIQRLYNEKTIAKWFFIRFNDKNGHHLRLRIQLNNTSSISKVTTLIHQQLSYFTRKKIVWKVQLDTYIPENERYGFDRMNETELAFQHDSDTCLQFFDLIEGDAGEKIRWLFALLSIDSYLNDFGISEVDKIAILKVAKNGFGSEFEKDKSTNKKINTIYNTNVDDIHSIFETEDAENPYVSLQELVKNRSEKIGPALLKIKASLDKENDPANTKHVLISHVHMICNRLFLTKQREHEAVVYDLLHQYYNRKAFRR